MSNVLAAIDGLYENVVASRFVSIACFALLVYDHILTFPQEVMLVWRAESSVVKWLFLINRYTVPLVITINVYEMGGLANTTSDLFVCKRWIGFAVNWELLSFAVMNAIASLRVHAIWGHQKDVRNLLVGSYVASYVTMVILLGVALSKLIPTVGWFPVINTCFAVANTEIWAVWIPGVAYEVVLFVLTLMKTLQHARTKQNVPIFHVLMRDSLVEFSVMFLGRFFNICVWAMAPQSLLLIGQHCVWAIVTIAASRLLLSLRGLRVVRNEDGTISRVRDARQPGPLPPLSANIFSTYWEEEDDGIPVFDIR